MAYYFQCPSCEGREHFSVPREQGSSLPLFLFLLGQWLAALVLIGNRQGRVQCGKCHLIFQQPPLPRSPVAKFATWILFVVALGVLAVFLAVVTSIDAASLPEFQAMLLLESLISSHLRAFTYVSCFSLALIVVSCVVAGNLSNRRLRRDYPDQLQPEPLPTEPPPAEEQVPVKG